MKRWVAYCSVLLLSASAQLSAEMERAVEVSFIQPEKFTDFRAANGGRNDGRNRLMSEIERFIRERADLWLPEGYSMTMVFNDIDLAGRIVPLPLRASAGGASMGGFGSAGEQRIVESPWPPRLNFDYQVFDDNGALAREGSADISTTQFLRLSPRARQQRRDGLWYEKAVIDSWMRELSE
ncbi:MAG: DUF3016 domain-containing protein [Xanthomonadales bacterium]|jgi:hypothetical protein|nr:DUF3016 domain-containing protein [Xanthomonadales bacterium]